MYQSGWRTLLVQWQQVRYKQQQMQGRSFCLQQSCLNAKQ
jgi:hypothetical protein